MSNIFSKILRNLTKAAVEDEWLEYEKKEVKELLEEKLQKSNINSNFGRQQRNIPTEPDKTAYDPDFGKPRPDPHKTVVDPNFGKSNPADLKPLGSEPTEVRPKLKSIEPPTRKMTRLPDLLEDQPPRKDLAEIEKAVRREEPPTRRMSKLTVKKGTAPRSSSGVTTKIAPAKIKLKSGKGLASKTRVIFKSVGKVVAVGAIASVIGLAIIDHLGVVIFEHAADEVIQKMGSETDLSRYLPDGVNNVVWSEAPYARYSREVSSDSLPNVLVDDIEIYPPQNGLLVFGISIADLPEFVNSINVNNLGEGNSDWLCEKYQEYLICRSMSKSYPLVAKLKNVVTLQYHLPGYELKEMLAAGSGSRAVYFMVK